MRTDWASKLEALSAADTWAGLRTLFAGFMQDVIEEAADDDPFLQTDLQSASYRLVTTRAAELLMFHEYEGRVRPSGLALVSLGGEARHEVTLRFDQDNAAILLADTGAYRDYLADLVDKLAWLGVMRCKGGVMASEPDWRGSVASWVERATYLLRGEISREDVRSLTIMLDMDHLFGEKALFSEVVSTIREGFPKAKTLQRYLAMDILEIPTYLTIFGRLAVEHREDRRGLFNFKFACLYPLVGHIRLEAWRHGITQASTRTRLHALNRAGHLSDQEAADHEDLLRQVVGLRFIQQRRQLEQGLPLSDLFRLDLYTDDERAALKRCVKRIESLKRRLRWVYWL